MIFKARRRPPPPPSLRETIILFGEMSALLVVPVLVLLSVGIDGTVPTATKTTSPAVDVVIASLQRLLDYFRRSSRLHPASDQQQQLQPGVFDVDTAFGLRVLEGQSKLLVDAYEHGELEFVGADGGPMKTVSVVGAEAGRLANVAIPHVHESDRKRFVILNGLIDGPFQAVRHQHRVVNPSLGRVGRGHRAGLTLDFDEDAVDRCYGELLMSTASVQQQQTKKTRNGERGASTKCAPTADCLMAMTSSGQSGRRLQRQIFYTILAQKTGCERQINEYLVSRTRFRNVDEAQHEFCTNAYYELEELTTSGIADVDLRDLFLEMEFHCPSVGYFQFMKMEWLQKIVAWQSVEGCFPKKEVESVAVRSGREDIENGRTKRIPMPADLLLRMHDGSNNVGQYFEVQRQFGHQLNAALGRRHRVNDDGPVRSDPFHHRPEDVRWHYGMPLNAGQRSDFDGRPLDVPVAIRNRRSRSIDNLSAGRQFHEERKLTGDCLSHSTSMAANALSMYLRFLLDPGPPEFLHLRIENFLKMPSTSDDNRHAFVARMESRGGGPTLVRPSSSERPSSTATSPTTTTTTTHASRIDVAHLVSQAWNFMGTYQRQWGPRYRPVHEAVDERRQRLPDFIHRADVTKELPDWTISLARATTTMESAQFLLLHRPSKASDVTEPSGKSTQERRSAAAVHVRIIQIQSPLQSDLDSYLVVVALVSTACLVAFLRYFRCRQPTSSGSGGKCKARRL